MNAQAVADVLNELHRLDPEAASRLIDYRTPCNQDVADHPRFQVVHHPHAASVIGILGVVNAMFDPEDRVAYITDEHTGKLVGFRVVDASGFVDEVVSIREAASKLGEKLGCPDWLSCIAVGDSIKVMLNYRPYAGDLVPDEWMGHKVECIVTGRIRFCKEGDDE